MPLFDYSKKIKTPIQLKPNYFVHIGHYYLLPIVSMDPGFTCECEPLNTAGMLRIYRLLKDDQHVGYAFTSAFKVVNGGGYLLTKTERFVKPTEYSVVLRMPDLVVYNFGSSGALATSPVLSKRVANIFMEQ